MRGLGIERVGIPGDGGVEGRQRHGVIGVELQQDDGGVGETGGGGGGGAGYGDGAATRVDCNYR